MWRRRIFVSRSCHGRCVRTAVHTAEGMEENRRRIRADPSARPWLVDSHTCMALSIHIVCHWTPSIYIFGTSPARITVGTPRRVYIYILFEIWWP